VASVGDVPAEVARPTYDRATVRVGIVHLGIGAFHRAHMADFIDRILESGDARWGILGVSLRSPAVRDQLAPQDGLYTLVVRDGSGDCCRIVGAVQQVLVAPENPDMVVAEMASPRVRIISLTITEKGYCHDPATGRLDNRHADIVHDLAHPQAPRSAIGVLAAALRARHAAGAGPVTILSCDNLPHNGAVLKQVMQDYIAHSSPELQPWIDANVSFPSTMIDRIVPATTDDDRLSLASRIGMIDQGMVKAEPFAQWVIEDEFIAGRPALEAVGVQMVQDVRPYELAKLRMLNGSHSTIAYLGLARGYEFVDQAIADPAIRTVVEHLMVEAAATLPDIGGFDPVRYASDLIDRFANPALAHRLAQIAMDGSQKLPQRLVQTIVERHAAGHGAPAAATGVAAWMQHLTGAFVNDPLSATLVPLAHAAGNDNRRLVDELSGIDAIFGDTGRQEWFRALVRANTR
jgi:fructuronate reductase